MSKARRESVSLRGLTAVAVVLGVCAVPVAGCRLHTEGGAPVAEQARAPDFALPAHDGRTVTLDELLARGPAIVVFHRGHW
jgi:cytochrome oxidase Cu insertion factor (SCO1/SenC/PrrC family)